MAVNKPYNQSFKVLLYSSDHISYTGQPPEMDAWMRQFNVNFAQASTDVPNYRLEQVQQPCYSNNHVHNIQLGIHKYHQNEMHGLLFVVSFTHSSNIQPFLAITLLSQWWKLCSGVATGGGGRGGGRPPWLHPSIEKVCIFLSTAQCERFFLDEKVWIL